MKLLEQQTNVDKARLLHELFPAEVPGSASILKRNMHLDR